MSSLIDLIKKLKVDASVAETYIYFDPSNGKIERVSNKKVEVNGLDVLAVPTEEAQPLLSGKKKTSEFFVKYDVSIKQMVLRELTYEDNNKVASTLCYEVPTIKTNKDGHITLTNVYDGVEVYIWTENELYTKGQFVWHNNNVYKLSCDVNKEKILDTSKHNLFVENVLLSTIPTRSHSIKKIQMNPEYVGVNVDIWYDKLEHYPGQHVWINNIVYRIKEYQEANTYFNINNAVVVVNNVKLYNDTNIALSFAKNLTEGDIVLDNNSLYSISYTIEEFEADHSSIFFYESNNGLIYYTNDRLLRIDTIKEDYTDTDLNIEIVENINLKNGNIVVIGKDLYSISISKDYDIIVQQNCQGGYWTVVLNPYTKKFLDTSGYSLSDTLYFSVTSKYDPNVLYRSIEVNANDLINKNVIIPFKYASEFTDQEVSIYTAKYFEHYAHEIIT